MTRYLDEFGDPVLADSLLGEIRRRTTRPWSIMEICGGQTHAIMRHGLDQLLPPELRLVHGPGCPVCVTPIEMIDEAIAIASTPDVTLCSFGDMMRVPGSHSDLLAARALGADVRIVYSPLDALTLAEAEPSREVVFFAVGFETTAPATAMAVHEAARRQVPNFSVLVSHVLVPPAIAALMAAPDSRVDAFLAAGHVCTVMGTAEYAPLAAALRVPIVITGFEPLDLLDGIRRAVVQLEEGRAEVENAYTRAVREAGNDRARELIDEVFTVVDRRWRGLGIVPASGWTLRDEFAAFDASRRFDHVAKPRGLEPSQCRAGDVLRGVITPDECTAFAAECTPRSPLGAPMVSSEGACAAYYSYRSGA